MMLVVEAVTLSNSNASIDAPYTHLENVKTTFVKTRPGVDKVKPKVWFMYSLYIIDWHFIMVQQGRLMMFSLNMLYYPMSFLLLST